MKFCQIGDYDKMLQIERKKLEGLIRDYITHLKIDKKLSYNTVHMYLASISHFYQMNDVTLNWKKLSKFKGKRRLLVEDKPYTKEQIRQLLDFADLRTKCVILLMSSAGLRRGALPALRIGDLQKIQKYGLYKISVYKNELESYKTFCTPECAKHLDQYFEWRKLQGEKLTDTSPVIRIEFNSLNVARPKAISTYSINWLINTLLDKSCIRPRSPGKLHKTEIMQCHAFRKYFETTSRLAGMNSLIIDRCMGHKTGLSESYTILSDDEILEGSDKMMGYIGAIGELSIDDSNRLRVKVTELTSKTKQNDYIINTRLEEKDKEIQKLKEQVTWMRQQEMKLSNLQKEQDQRMKYVEVASEANSEEAKRIFAEFVKMQNRFLDTRIEG
jgi:integrase